MPLSLRDIDIEAITTLEQAKKVLHQIFNVVEQQMQLVAKLTGELQEARAEIARLKGQPRKPQYAKKGGRSISVTKLLQETGKKPWHKKAKGGIPIDRHVQLPEKEECECGSTEFKTVRTTTKIMQGVIVTRNNTAYHGRTKECLNCHKQYAGTIPDDLKHASFDPALRSLLSYWKFFCRMTYPLIHRMLTGFGIQISYGEINGILLTNGDKLAPVHRHLKTTGFAKSRHLQTDASGAKRKDKKTHKIQNQYIQVIGNALLSVFAITKHYDSKTLNRLLGRVGRKKALTTDDGSPNGECLMCNGKQLCWVHEIRLYKKIFPYFTMYRQEREQILSQWQRFYHLAKIYGRDPTGKKRKEIVDLFDEITSQETGYAELNKQLRLTRNKKDRLLFFLDHPDMPINNNQCEQDLREFVIQRNISRETKSTRGDRSIARHLSVIQTAQKQRLDIFSTLHGILTGKLSASVLTANIV